MRRLVTVVACGLAAFGAAMLGWGDDPAVEGAAAALALPGRVAASVVDGDRWVAVTAEGRLVSADLAAWRVTDHGTLDAELLPHVDAAGGTICVAARDGVRVLAGGGPARRVAGAPPLRGLRLAGEGRVVVHGRTDVKLIMLADGRPVWQADLGATDAEPDLAQALLVESDSVYVSHPGVAHVTRLELATGKKTGTLEVGDVVDLALTGDVAYVISRQFGYGVVYYRPRAVTVKGGEPHVIDVLEKIPASGDAAQDKRNRRWRWMRDSQGQLHVVGGPWVGRVSQPSEPKLLRCLPAGTAGEIVGLWRDLALVVNDKSLQLVKLVEHGK